VEALKRQRAAQAEAKLAHGWPELPAYIFTMPNGGKHGRELLGKAFARVLGKARLADHFTPKSLRHSYASILLSEGANLLYVSRQLGHSSWPSPRSATPRGSRGLSRLCTGWI